MRKHRKILTTLLLAAIPLTLTNVAFAAEADPEYVFKVVSEQAPEIPESEAHIIQMALDAYIAAGHPNFSYEFEVCDQNELLTMRTARPWMRSLSWALWLM